MKRSTISQFALVSGTTALLAGLLAGCGTDHTAFRGETVVAVGTPPPPPPPVEAPKPRVVVENSHITITEKIQFEDAKAGILPASNSLLDEIATVIKAHSEIKKVRVEGHSSSEGKAAFNTKLSDDRAKAVVAALVTRGVDKGVLTAKGYGSSQPLEKPDDTEEKKEKNRRVDFVITDPKDPNAPADTKADKAGDKGMMKPKADKPKTDKGAAPATTKGAATTTPPKGKP